MSHLDDQTSYEELPYPETLCYSQTHPDRLATIATLLGLEVAPVDSCRVLELGCASGGNLLPMAEGLPGSQFVGVDYAANQIETGRKVIDLLGLENARLECEDITQIGPDFGQFDYIVAHGLYSWVPGPVRDKVLAICSQNLAPNGVAYVSYNTYPGWHMLINMREMMLYHARETTNAKTLVEGGIHFMEFLADYLKSDNVPYGTLIPPYAGLAQHHWERAQNIDPALMLHDELSTVNHPVYFHQFAEAAQQHGLQYLSEANFPLVMPTNVNRKGAEFLQKYASNLIELEQYMDFMRNRTFRQSLLIHQGIEVRRNLRPDPDQMARFSLASNARPVDGEIDTHSEEAVQFTAIDKSILSVNRPVSKAALLHLASVWPQIVPFGELFEAASTRVYGDDTATQAANAQQDMLLLAAHLLQGFTISMKLVELHAHTPRFSRTVSERPIASRLSRHYSAEGHGVVANARHERINLDPLSLNLLPWLDGEHDQPALLDKLEELVKAGKITVNEKSGEPASDPERAREILGEELSNKLQKLAEVGLLVA